MRLLSDTFSSKFPLKELQIEDYFVSYEDSQDNLTEHFAPLEKKQFLSLLHEAQMDPKNAYKKALDWKEKKPKNPLLDNLLTYLHLQNGQKEKGEALILEAYHNYPSYFFAKINYADQCLRLKKLSQIPLIFPSFHLKDLFPGKNRFHVSEFRGFMILASRYHLAIRQKELAKEYYQKAYLADPAHPSLIFLEKELFSQNRLFKSLNLFRKFLKL